MSAQSSCKSCGRSGVTTRKRTCGRCEKDILVCTGCRAGEANTRSKVTCSMCQIKIKNKKKKKQ